MNTNAIVNILNEIFVSSCTNLFEELDCKVETVDGDQAALEGAPFGYIDAGSDDLELTVALRLPMTVLVMTYPICEDALNPDEETLEDWVSELTNQLIGKIKRRLLQHDCLLRIGLPMALFGANLDDAMPPSAIQLSTYMTVDKALCECRLAIEIFNENMEFSLNAQEDTGSSGGDLEFF